MLLVTVAACQSTSGPSEQPGPDDVRTVQIQVSSNSDSLGARMTDMGGQEIGIDRSNLPVTSQFVNEVEGFRRAQLRRAHRAGRRDTQAGERRRGVSRRAGRVGVGGHLRCRGPRGSRQAPALQPDDRRLQK